VVCRRGHVASYDLRFRAPEGSRCTTCGAKLLRNCPGCGQRIRGDLFVPGVIVAVEWTPDEFCDRCGAAFPWASWQARIWALENMLDEEELDEADRLRIIGVLNDIAERGESFDKNEEQKAWGRVKELWPSLGEKAWTIAAPLITAEVKRKLGLPA
jgi:hypothetical protein